MNLSILSRRESSFARERREMVRYQLRDPRVRNRRVLRAMGDVLRHEFVPLEMRQYAYHSHPVPIGHEQTISQPLMVAIMLEVLNAQENERVLDVGTGSGYQAALLSRLAEEVTSIEIIPQLARAAEENLRRARCRNVSVIHGDGSLGWEAGGPYDAIIVAAGSPRVPAALLDQLADGGRLVIPVGEFGAQRLLCSRKRNNIIRTDEITACTFVPLVGRGGWPSNRMPSESESTIAAVA